VTQATETTPVVTPLRTLLGGCHCGRLQVAYTTAQDPAGVHPRACDCTFCRKHGAAYVSDPAGRLAVAEREPGALRRYRQGSDTADFLLCGHCGVLVTVTVAHGGRVYGAVNAGCLDGDDAGAGGIFAGRVPASPQSLGREERLARWTALWVPDVTITAGDVPRALPPVGSG